jgi:hypothetical protein
MPTFTAEMRVIHHEAWEVEAKDEAEARRKIMDMHDDVVTDETGGEVVDLEILKVRAG